MDFLVKTIPVGPIDVNCYVLKDNKSNSGLVIDPGDDAKVILRYIRENNIAVKGIVNTHGHWDHIGAVDVLRDKLGVGLAIHEADAHMLTDNESSMATFFGVSTSSRPAEHLLQDGDYVNFGSCSLRVIHTPGHTPGGICLYGGGALFSGDTLFAGSVGRCDFPGGSEEAILNSIRVKLAMVADAAKVYPGHGPASTMEHERRYNPYF